MKTNEILIHQAAARVANALRQKQVLPHEALRTLAFAPEKARDALTHFGATRVMRQLGKDGELKPQGGQTLIFYKAPLPGEQQARLSYEYLLSEFGSYLRRQCCALVTSESSAHLGVWLPDEVTLDLYEAWEHFITEMTSSVGLSRGFGLVMNSSKLSDRGFSTLETPVVSKAQAPAIAAFYLANLKHVETRLWKRQRSIETGVESDGESSKRLVKEQETQKKELKKYREGFGKIFSRALREELAVHAELAEIEADLAQADAKTRKKLERQRERKKQGLRFDAKTAQALQELDNSDPFVFMRALASHPKFGTVWRKAEVEAASYSSVAANQLSTQKGDIYAKVIWETCGLLYGQLDIVPLRPLLSEQVITWGVRTAGDNKAEACYSCGRPLEGTTSFPSRRLLFESPDQRTQSGGSSGAVIVCSDCAALSILSPVKFAPDTLVVRFYPLNEEQEFSIGVAERVKQASEQHALNELGTSAGHYVNLSCTERDKDAKRTLAVQKLGRKQYAYVKLASLYPTEVLSNVQAVYYDNGREIRLSRTVLVATSILMRAFRQGILTPDGINMKLGEAIRLLERHHFMPACYVLARSLKKDNQPAPVVAWLDEGLAIYYGILREENADMANMTADVQALVGLLIPACSQLMAIDEKGIREAIGREVADVKAWRNREVAKLIQQIDSEEPTTFTYSSAKTVGGVAYLRRTEFNRFAFDQAKRLIEKRLVEDGLLQPSDLPTIFNEKDGVPSIKITNDLIASAFYYFKAKYKEGYERKTFFYHVKLGLFSRFTDAL